MGHDDREELKTDAGGLASKFLTEFHVYGMARAAFVTRRFVSNEPVQTMQHCTHWEVPAHFSIDNPPFRRHPSSWSVPRYTTYTHGLGDKFQPNSQRGFLWPGQAATIVFDPASNNPAWEEILTVCVFPPRWFFHRTRSSKDFVLITPPICTSFMQIRE